MENVFSFAKVNLKHQLRVFILLSANSLYTVPYASLVLDTTFLEFEKNVMYSLFKNTLYGTEILGQYHSGLTLTYKVE